METEGKLKVVASVWGAKFVHFLDALAVLSWSIWGADFVQFLAVLAVLPRSVWKKQLKLREAKQLAWQGIEQNLPPKQMQQPLPLLLSPSFFYDQHRQRGGVDHWTVDNPPQHQIVFNFLALYLWACCSTDVLSDGLPSVLSVRAGNSFRE